MAGTLSDWLANNPGAKIIGTQSGSSGSRNREDADKVAYFDSYHRESNQGLGNDPGEQSASQYGRNDGINPKSERYFGDGSYDQNHDDQRMSSPDKLKEATDRLRETASVADQYARKAIQNLRRTVLEALMSTTTASSSFFASFPDFTRGRGDGSVGGIPPSTVKRVRRRAIAAVLGEEVWGPVENKFVLSGPAWADADAVTRALGALEAAEETGNIDNPDARMAAWKQMVSGIPDSENLLVDVASSNEKLRWLRDQGYITFWTQGHIHTMLPGMGKPDWVESMAKGASYVYFAALTLLILLILTTLWKWGIAIIDWVVRKLTIDLEEQEATPPKKRSRRVHLNPKEEKPPTKAKSALKFETRASEDNAKATQTTRASEDNAKASQITTRASEDNAKATQITTRASENNAKATQTTPLKGSARWANNMYQGAEIVKGDLGHYYKFPTSDNIGHTHSQEELMRFSQLYGPPIVVNNEGDQIHDNSEEDSEEISDPGIETPSPNPQTKKTPKEPEITKKDSNPEKTQNGQGKSNNTNGKTSTEKASTDPPPQPSPLRARARPQPRRIKKS